MARTCPVCGDELCFDHCSHCGAEGCEAGTVVHADGCPHETGVFPVREDDLYEPGRPCEKCGHRNYVGMRCSECRCEFALGDHYTHRKIGDNVYEPICLGCAAKEALA